ncbi:hypothetical protein G4B88_017584 [Cannabis sativa]|uniref:RNase H type-1 domain-containing protein n=1 Tax=Cannabis sativa TaxID=3483 RepID=A0A7J6I3D3_CANSA|nr:hypothetical protein G4B88_017584 [Cannabis sativa]
MLWKIWNNRNSFVFRHLQEQLSTTYQEALDYLHSYKQAQGKQPKCAQDDTTIITWTPSKACQFKLNVDGAVSAKEEKIGAWALVRSSTGQIIAAFAKSNHGMMQPRNAEVWALLQALLWCQNNHILIH